VTHPVRRRPRSTTADGALDLPHDWSIEDLPYAPPADGSLTADPSLLTTQVPPTEPVFPVSFDLRGAGSLAAVGNGNPHNVDSFKQPRRHTWHGQALAILRPAKHPGDLTVTATTPGLRSATLQLRVTGGRR
jgi:hypothetical protein